MQRGLDRVDFRADDRDVGKDPSKRGRRLHPGVELGVISALARCVGAVGLPLILAGVLEIVEEPTLLEPGRVASVVGGWLVFGGVVVVASVAIGGVPASVAGAVLGHLLWDRRIGAIEVLSVLGLSLVVAGAGTSLLGASAPESVVLTMLVAVGGTATGTGVYAWKRPTWRSGPASSLS